MVRSQKNADVAAALHDDELRLLTTEEVSILLGVSEVTVQRYVKNKSLRCVRVGRRNTRFRRKDVRLFQDKHITTGGRVNKPRKKTATP